MADGRLVFPVKFDLQKAVKEASGDIDNVLHRLETMVQHRPLQVKIAIDEKSAGGTSIKAIQSRMSELITEWEKMSNKVKYTDDSLKQYSERAKQIISEFATLTAATRTHAQTLGELQRAADKAAAAEEKRMAAQQRAVAKSQQTVAMLKAEETSLTAVAAKRKFYQGIADRHSFGTKEYQYATQQLERLGAQYERLKAIMNSNTGNGGKNIINAENIKATLRGAENTIESVKAKLNALEQVMAKTPQDSFGFRRAAEEAERLYRIKQGMESKSPKAQIKEQEKAIELANRENQARQAAYNAQRQAGLERQRILKAEETSLDRVNAKLAMQQQRLGETKTTSAKYKKIAEDIQRLTAVQRQFQAVQQAELAQLQREYNTVKSLISALQGYGNTIGQIQAKLSAFQSTLSSATIGGAAFREAAYQIKMMNEQLNRANQLVQNYQSKSLEGVGKKNTDAAVRQMEQLQERIRQIDAQMNLAHAKGQDMGSQKMIQLLQERITLEEKLNNVMTTGADAAKARLDAQIAAQQKLIEETAKHAEAYNRKRQQEAEDLAAQQRKAAEEARIKAESQAKAQQENEARKRILNEQRLSYDTLIQKIQMLEAARNKTDIGAARWTRLTKEIDKTRESLKVITDEMDKAAKRSERLARLREIFSMSEQSMAGLSARLQEYNSKLQRLDVGTAAFDRTAQKVSALSAELQRASQFAQDFAQKAFQGLSAGDTTKRVQELQYWRSELQRIDEQYNKLRNIQMTTGLNRSQEQAINDLFNQRKTVVENIKQSTLTCEQAALEQERKISEEKRRQAALAQKQQARQSQKSLLASQSKDIDTLTRKLQYYQNLLNRLDFNAKPQTFTQVAKEVERLTKDLDDARRKMAELTGQSTSGTSKQAANARKVSEEYSKQLTYVDRLIRRMAVYGSIGMVGNFLTKVREVTAQFELQRVSLGAILQDQNKANQLFSEIKSFALKSPVSILDLTKYTKQLAAYRIGYDELFETTKKLTDVSVGLGVSMDRVVLAYGQVRATGHLRASEIRQFTEMGVPIVEELAAKLSKLNGETVTAAQVMDMASKRAISFQMVKDVFDDMTSAGGIFYNMQEKQGNTLYGLWAKLGDAASVMYSEIGNTGIVNDGMKSLISSMTWLMKNWRLMVGEITVAAAGFGAYKLVQALVTKNTIAASRATRDYARAQAQLNAVQKGGGMIGAESAAKYAMRAAAANRIAANSTNLWTAAKYRLIGATNSLKAAFMGNWITLAITAIVAVSVAIAAAVEKATRLNRELAKIKEETGVLQAQSARNFEYLANSAVKATDGSKQQKDALDELNRTYGDMVPSESLKIENLRKMKGNYDELTQSVREYIAAEQEQKAINTVNETEGAVQTDMQKKLRGVMTDKGLGTLALSDTEVERFFIAFRETSQDASKTVKEQFVEAFREAGLKGAEEMWAVVKKKNESWFTVGPGIFGSEEDNVKARSAIGELSRSFREQEEQINGVREAYRQMTDDLGVYTDAMKTYTTWVEKNSNSGETFLQNQQNVNMQIRGMGGSIRKAMQEAGLVWKDEWANVINDIDPNDLSKTTTLNMEAIIAAIDPNKYPDLWKYIDAFRKKYNDLIPPDPTVQQIRAKMLAISQSMGISMDTMRRFLWDGSASVDEHLKYLNDQIDQYEAKLKKLQTTFANSGIFGSIASLFLKGKIEETTKIVKALKEQAEFVKTYTVPEKSENKGGRKSDTRLQELQEINQTLDKINKEYDDLSKKEGKSKALEDIRKQFKDTLDYTNKLGKKFGLHFDYPTEFKSLQQYREQILKVMKSLKNLKGGEKAILEFQTMIGKADSDYLQKQIEQQLKDIAERISRAKVADEFYQKILSATGDYSLAGQIAEGIFGQDGRKLKAVMAEQVRALTNGLKLPSGIISPDNIINHKALREWAEANKVELGDMYKELVKISEQGQKDLAKSYEGYLKDLEKAKTFADKLVELSRTTAQKLREIEEEGKAKNYSKEQVEKLKRGYLERQTREEAKLEWEAFKDMPIYVQMFEDLEHASTSTLTMMRNHLNGLRGMWGSALAPTQIKEIQSRIEDIEKQLETRNPWKMLRESWLKYRDALKSYNPDEAVKNVGKASDNYLNVLNDYGKDSAQAKMAEQELGVQEKLLEISRKLTNDKGKRLKGTKALDKANQLAYRNQLIAQQDLNNALADEEDAIAKHGKDSDEYKAAHAVVEEKKTELEIAEKVSEITQENANTATKWRDSMEGAVNEIVKYMTMASDAARSIADLTEAFGGSEEDVQFWNDIADGLGKVTEGFEDLMKNILSLNISGIISSAITAVPKMIIGFMDIFSAGRIRKANKEIKKQQNLLDQLEYSYSRLEKTAEKLFGADWLRNQNQQLKMLEAEARAKEKQAEAERSKGKKEDKEKTKQYLEEARDIRDQIADMEGSVSEKMFGTDLAGAARDFAQAWLDAYKEFGNTADAMSEKFHEMIENMIVESLLTKVMQRALEPAFKMIDNMSDSDFYSEVFWKRLMQTAEDGATNADHGAQVVMDWVEKMGFDIRGMGGEFSGIAKNIAGATSEEINSVAAIGNTLMYYVSPIPRIDENVARIVAIMENGGVVPVSGGSAYPASDYTGLLNTANEHLSSLPRMEQHLAEIHTMLGRIITSDGRYSGVNIFMRK